MIKRVGRPGVKNKTLVSAGWGKFNFSANSSALGVVGGYISKNDLFDTRNLESGVFIQKIIVGGSFSSDWDFETINLRYEYGTSGFVTETKQINDRITASQGFVTREWNINKFLSYTDGTRTLRQVNPGGDSNINQAFNFVRCIGLYK